MYVPDRVFAVMEALLTLFPRQLIQFQFHLNFTPPTVQVPPPLQTFVHIIYLTNLCYVCMTQEF